jgi:AcrR family transcriptional regulator
MTREQKKAQTRAKLLKSAERAFTRHGYFAASVEDIAERAGFSIGAVYSNFGSKADLFLTLFEEHIAEQMSEYLAVAASEGPLEQRARAGGDRWMAYLREHPAYFPLFLEFAAYAARERRLMPALATRLDAFHQAFSAMVVQAAAARGTELPEQVAASSGLVINALANGLALAKLADPDAVSDELFGHVLALLLSALTEGAREGRSA